MQYLENRRWETFALGTRGPESKAKVTPYRPHDQTGDHDGCISDGAESIGRRFLGCGDVAQALYRVHVRVRFVRKDSRWKMQRPYARGPSVQFRYLAQAT